MKGHIMEGPEVGESQSIEKKSSPKPARRGKKILLLSIVLIVLVAVGVGIWLIVRYGVPKAKEIGWTSNQMVALYIAGGVILVVALAWLILRRTLRTRMKMERVLKEDPDIDDWLSIFNWTSKILYVPTIIASLLACVLMYLSNANVWFFGSIPDVAIGGIWLAIFFFNFLVEEYSISIKILLIGIVGVGCLLLWLHLLGWVPGFLGLFRHLALSINATGYLLISLIGLLTILISWLKGLFYYITITPNYMNLQEGPTESGEQIGREDYNSRIDTSDFLERLMGFGRIIITFKDRKREPITVLVWRIRKKAQMLENVRATFAIDRVEKSLPPQF
jgi:MFS family permease